MNTSSSSIQTSEDDKLFFRRQFHEYSQWQKWSSSYRRRERQRDLLAEFVDPIVQEHMTLYPPPPLHHRHPEMMMNVKDVALSVYAAGEMTEEEYAYRHRMSHMNDLPILPPWECLKRKCLRPPRTTTSIIVPLPSDTMQTPSLNKIPKARDTNEEEEGENIRVSRKQDDTSSYQKEHRLPLWSSKHEDSKEPIIDRQTKRGRPTMPLLPRISPRGEPLRRSSHTINRVTGTPLPTGSVSALGAATVDVLDRDESDHHDHCGRDQTVSVSFEDVPTPTVGMTITPSLVFTASMVERQEAIWENIQSSRASRMPEEAQTPGNDEKYKQDKYSAGGDVYNRSSGGDKIDASTGVTSEWDQKPKAATSVATTQASSNPPRPISIESYLLNQMRNGYFDTNEHSRSDKPAASLPPAIKTTASSNKTAPPSAISPVAALQQTGLSSLPSSSDQSSSTLEMEGCCVQILSQSRTKEAWKRGGSAAVVHFQCLGCPQKLTVLAPGEKASGVEVPERGTVKEYIAPNHDTCNTTKTTTTLSNQNVKTHTPFITMVYCPECGTLAPTNLMVALPLKISGIDEG